MSAPRFYCNTLPHHGSTLELPPEAAHHARRVLRLRENDPVQIFDGAGNVLNAIISEISGKRVVLCKLKPCDDEPPPPLHIVLAQAMCGSEKMDWIVQKATELGAAEIQPVQTQRSVAKLAGERIEKRSAHWHNVIIAACEQCGRNLLPQIHAPQEFSAWLAQIRDTSDAKLMLSPESAATLYAQPKPQGGVILLIGPEGGFSTDEIKMAHLAGFSSIRLGRQVLRTETAAMAGIAALQTLWGDFQ